MSERELAVVQHQIKDHVPKATVFTDSAKPSTLASLKRHRFIQNLKNNHTKLIEALNFVERFAAICELSKEKLDAIKHSKDAAIEELITKFEEKIKAYDARIKEDSL